jgi:hypothetical protein
MLAFALARPYLAKLFMMEWKFAEKLVEDMDFLIILDFPIYYQNMLATLHTREKTPYFIYKLLDIS